MSGSWAFAALILGPFRALCALALTVLAAGSALAQPIGPEFRVNTTTAGYQFNADVAGMGTGFVVVWSNYPPEGISGQRFDGSGNPAGPEFAIEMTTTYPSFPSVAADPTHGFVVVWEDYGTGEIVGRRYSNAGAPLGDQFQTGSSSSHPAKASVAMDPSGGFVVAWASGDGDYQGVFARAFDSAGAPVSAQFQVNQTTASDQSAPVVAAQGAGQFVVVWQTGDRWSFVADVMGRRFDTQGTALGPEFPVNTTTFDNQFQPAVAADAAGNFVVAWSDYGTDGSQYGVFGQRFDATGLAVGSEFQANGTTNSDQTRPSIGLASNGGFVVVWESSSQEGSNNPGIYAQRYDSAGNPVGGESHLNTTTVGSQENPVVAAGAGKFFAAWQGRGDGDTYGIFARRGTVPLPGDQDGDGTLDGSDGCPGDPEKLAPGVCGCGVADSDTDGDGALLCNDGCPDDPTMTDPGACGCGIPETDSDGDATPDCVDGCPTDAGKTTPGACGCGTADLDGDGDGSLVCFDCADSDPNRRPGLAEMCDGADNDCDGVTDEGFLLGAPCDGPDADFCPEGVTVCAGATTGCDDATGDDATCADPLWIQPVPFGLEFDLDHIALARRPGGGWVVVRLRPEFDYPFTLVAQFYDENFGAPAGPEIEVADYTPDASPIGPLASVAAGPSGFVVAWEQSSAPFGPYGVFVRRFDAAGTPLGPAVRLGQTDPTARLPVVAMNDAGAYLVAWGRSSIAFDTFPNTLRAKLFDPDGTATTSELVLGSCSHTFSPGFVVASAGPDNFAIACKQTNQILVHRFNGDGTTRGAPIQFGGTYDTRPSVACDPFGGVAVTWTLFPSGSGGCGAEACVNTDVWVRRYDATGVLLGSETRVDSNSDRADDFSQLAFDATGKLLVVWTSEVNVSESHVVGRTFSPTGDSIGSEFSLSSTTTHRESGASVVAGDSGRYLATWSSFASPLRQARLFCTGPCTEVCDGTDNDLDGLTDESGDTDGDGTLDCDESCPADPAKLEPGACGCGVADLDSDGDGALLCFDECPDDPTHVQAALDTPEIPVNETTAAHQSTPAVAAAADGSFVVVWHSFGAPGTAEVFGRLHTADGTPLGGEFQVNTFNANDQFEPAVARSATGEFVIAWTSTNQDGSSFGIVAQRYDSAGVPQGGEFQVNAVTAGPQFFPSVAMSAAGDFVVSWTGATGNVAQRRFPSTYPVSGTPGPEVVVNTTVVGTQRRSNVAMNAAGDSVVVWQNGSSFPVTVRGQRFDSSGAAVGPEFVVSAEHSIPSDSNAPSVSMDDSGGFVVAWEQLGVAHDVLVRRYDDAGTPLGDAFPVVPTWNGERRYAWVGASNAGFVVCWEAAETTDTAFPDGLGVFAQRFDTDGLRIGDEFQVNRFTTANQRFPQLALVGDKFIVVWHSNGQDGDGLGVYVRTGTLDTDADRDGTPDCADECPSDPDKSTPGDCGCGAPDTDSDGDGAADCIDGCAVDPDKQAPGACGCGIADTDSDADGAADCVDRCPAEHDPDQRDSDGDGAGDVCDVCAVDPADQCDPAGSAGGNVDESGGSVATPDGSVQLVVPPGSLPGDTSISITEGVPGVQVGVDGVVAAFELGPDGQTFSPPVLLTIAWTDQDDDGVVDGTSVQEATLFVIKDGTPITGDCSALAHQPGTCTTACCDPAANTWTVALSSFSQLVLQGDDCVPTPEICDGADNDCDGAVDDGFGVGLACEGVGACGAGVLECAGPDATQCSTDPGGSADQSQPESCDGVDNDCDGRSDDASTLNVTATRSMSRPKRVIVEPIPDLPVGAYETGASSCAKVVCRGTGWQHYACIVANCTPVDEDITDEAGQAQLSVPGGTYLVIGGDGTIRTLAGSATLGCGQSRDVSIQEVVK